MKRAVISVLVALLAASECGLAGIVNNSGNSPEDSISVVFQLLDSLGCPVALESSDSLYFAVFGPGGNLCFKDSLVGTDSRLESSNWHGSARADMYSFRESVAAVDGDGVSGTYRYMLTVDDISLGLRSSAVGEFQVYTTSDYSVALDIGFQIEDSIEQLSQRLAVLQDSVDVLADSLADQVWASIGEGTDSASIVRWVNFATWGLYQHEDSSSILDRTIASSGTSNWSDSQRDSILEAIEDVNKVNFHSSGDTIGRNASVLVESDNIGLDLSNVVNQDAPLLLANTYTYGVGLVDTASIARSVWNNDIVESTARRIAFTDTAGTTLNAPSGGGGAYACSLYCLGFADSAAIQGATIRLMNSVQNATVGIASTDPNGLAVFSLDESSYFAWAYLTGYTFDPIPRQVVVNEPALTDTLFAHSFDPGSPPEPGLCRVYGWVLNLSGDGIAGATIEVAARKPPIRYGATVVSPFFESTTSDSLGYWYLDLIPSSNLTPPSTGYRISIYYESGVIAVKDVQIPDTSSWQFQW